MSRPISLVDRVGYYLRIKKAHPILRVGHPLLRTKCVPVPVSDISNPTSKCAEAVNALKSVFASPYHSVVGLAAPQIGSPLKIIAYQFVDSKLITSKRVSPTPLTVLINPKLAILEAERKWTAEYESCESLPHYNAIVKRPEKVRVEAIGENGEDIRFDANGYLARVLHHEMDHLDGITLVERMVPHTLRHDQYIDVFENFPK